MIKIPSFSFTRANLSTANKRLFTAACHGYPYHLLIVTLQVVDFFVFLSLQVVPCLSPSSQPFRNTPATLSESLTIVLKLLVLKLFPLLRNAPEVPTGLPQLATA